MRGECSYQAELDVHFPTLTVAETLDLAAEARYSRSDRSLSLNSRDVQENRENTVSALGLSHALNTKVGSDSLPGISGGERKRLSIAEVLVGSTSLQFWDNSTRGLDSVNALQFVKTLKRTSNARGSAAVVSLYQASQDMYNVRLPCIML